MKDCQALEGILFRSTSYFTSVQNTGSAACQLAYSKSSSFLGIRGLHTPPPTQMEGAAGGFLRLFSIQISTQVLGAYSNPPASFRNIHFFYPRRTISYPSSFLLTPPLIQHINSIGISQTEEHFVELLYTKCLASKYQFSQIERFRGKRIYLQRLHAPGSDFGKSIKVNKLAVSL